MPAWGSNRADGVRSAGTGHPRHLQRGPRRAVAQGRRGRRPRSRRGARAMPTTCESLFAVLADRTRTPDGELPATGISLDWERRLSSPFIVGEEVGYGTRSSTVVTLGRDGAARFVERTFDPAGRQVGEADFSFALLSCLSGPRISARSR